MGAEERGGKLSPWLSQKRMRLASRYFRGRVLDFGCNDGALVEYCKPDAYLGVDIAENGLTRARAAHPEYRFAAAVPDGERFDTVAALAMIEHVADPGGMIATFAGLLEPGGWIVLTTPHPRLEWAHTVGAKLHLLSSEAHDEHEELLGRQRMQELVEPLGLRIAVYDRFLFGANQLFVLAPVKAADPPTGSVDAAPEAGAPAGSESTAER